MMWEVNEGVKFGLGILGNLTALAMFLVPMKTIVSIIRNRSTEEFSVFPYVMTLLNCLLWTWYGLPIVGPGRTLVITINAAGVGLEAFYVAAFFSFTTRKKRVRTVLYTGIVLAFFGAVAAVTVAAFHTSSSRSLFVGIINNVVTIIMYGSPLEIMWLVIRTRSVKFMPFFLSLLSFGNGLAWTAYATYVLDIYILIPNAVGTVLGAVQLILYARYHSIEVTESRRHMMSKSMSENTSMEGSSLERLDTDSPETSDGVSERTSSGKGTEDVELAVSRKLT